MPKVAHQGVDELVAAVHAPPLQLGVHFGQVPAVDAGSLTTLVGVAGLTFILKVGGGLYWLIPAAVVSLVGARSTRGLFVVRVTS